MWTIIYIDFSKKSGRYRRAKEDIICSVLGRKAAGGGRNNVQPPSHVVRYFQARVLHQWSASYSHSVRKWILNVLTANKAINDITTGRVWKFLLVQKHPRMMATIQESVTGIEPTEELNSNTLTGNSGTILPKHNTIAIEATVKLSWCFLTVYIASQKKAVDSIQKHSPCDKNADQHTVKKHPAAYNAILL